MGELLENAMDERAMQRLGFTALPSGYLLQLFVSVCYATQHPFDLADVGKRLAFRPCQPMWCCAQINC
jgi:hypothetical protein